jgi:hypothetical protein
MNQGVPVGLRPGQFCLHVVASTSQAMAHLKSVDPAAGLQAEVHVLSFVVHALTHRKVGSPFVGLHRLLDSHPSVMSPLQS